MSTAKIRNTTTEILTRGSFFDGLPGAIEASERAGQRDLERAEQFPAKMGDSREAFERMGLVFIGPTQGDSLFLDCRLPPGWRKVGTDHAMWSDLLDDKGRKRGAIFYKAAFYDRRAHASARRRFGIITRGFDEYTRWEGYVIDESVATTGEAKHVIHHCEPVVTKEKNWDGEREVAKRCVDWLAANVPGYADPCAHWDDEPMPAVCVFPAWSVG